MKLVFPSIALALLSCTSNTAIIPDNGVAITYIDQEERREGEHLAVVAEFELVNGSSEEICALEDIFLNDLSPYISVRETSEVKRSSEGVPNPPKSTSIIHVLPGASRRFYRVVDYVRPGESSVNDYQIAVDLSFCKDGKRFVEHASLHSDPPM